MKPLLLTVLALTTGCAEFNAMVNEYGARAASQALTVAEYGTCIASPIGAVRARYDTPAKLQAYNAFCKSTESAFVLGDD